MLPLMTHSAVLSAFPLALKALSSPMTAPRTPLLELPLLRAAVVIALTSSSFWFSAISSFTINPHFSLKYRSIATGKLFVPRSALFSVPGVEPIWRIPRLTSCCTHSTLQLRWRIFPTPSRLQMPLAADESRIRFDVIAKPMCTKTSRMYMPSLVAPAAE